MINLPESGLRDNFAQEFPDHGLQNIMTLAHKWSEHQLQMPTLLMYMNMHAAPIKHTLSTPHGQGALMYLKFDVS